MQRRPRPASNEAALPDVNRPFLPWLSDPVSVSTTADAEAGSASDADASSNETSTESTSAVADTASASPRTSTWTRDRSRTRTTRPDTFALDDLVTSSDPSHEVVVANQSDVRHEVRVVVTGSERRDVRHADTNAVAADATRTLLDTADLDPDGVETFHVTVETDADAVDCRLRTNACTGDLRVLVRADGTLDATRSIA